MGKAIVNRMWGHFLGYGFTKPVDDMGPHNPPSHPELLEHLATGLRQPQLQPEGADPLDHAQRAVFALQPMNVEPIQRRQEQVKDDPLLGDTPLFTHFYLRQMQAEELYESLLVATEAHKTRGSLRGAGAARSRHGCSSSPSPSAPTRDDEATTFNGTIPQALMMMNGDLIKKATSRREGQLPAPARRQQPEGRRQDQLPVPGRPGPQADARRS